MGTFDDSPGTGAKECWIRVEVGCEGHRNKAPPVVIKKGASLLLWKGHFRFWSDKLESKIDVWKQQSNKNKGLKGWQRQLNSQGKAWSEGVI